jgi:3',5'-cyclic AMP phosphodiesterase CpdA
MHHMTDAPFTFLHLTDLHVTPAGAPPLYGLDPGERLATAVADIARRHGPGSDAPAAFAVITGDLTHHGEPEAYARLRAILAGLPCPAHLMLGNHDERDVFHAAFPNAARDDHGFVQQVVATPAGRFIMLDSKVPGTHAGGLCRARLDWLAARLAEDDSPVFLFIHHPPYSVGITAMDAIPLRDAEALWDVLAPHRGRIRHLFHGHLHRPIAGSWRGIPASSLRGMSHQVGLDFAQRPTTPGSHEQPAYAVVRATTQDVVVHSHDFLDATGSFDL